MCPCRSWSISLLSAIKRCSRIVLHFLSPDLDSGCCFSSPGSFYWRMVFRSPDMGHKYAYCYWHVAATSSRENVCLCVCVYRYSHVYIYICITTYTHISTHICLYLICIQNTSSSSHTHIQMFKYLFTSLSFVCLSVCLSIYIYWKTQVHTMPPILTQCSITGPFYFSYFLYL